MITFQSIEPQVFTAEEACTYLRLTEGREMPQALRALKRLVDEKKLIRALTYAECRMYSRAELDRFLRDQIQ